MTTKMRWMPHGWAIILNSMESPGRWRYEVFADGIKPIKGPSALGVALRNEREAASRARQELRRAAFNLMTAAWNPLTGTSHGAIRGQLVAICNMASKLSDAPDLGKKTSPKCFRCEQILGQLYGMFSDEF